MKERIGLLLLAAFLLAACSGAQTSSTTAPIDDASPDAAASTDGGANDALTQRTRVYATLVSHNDESSSNDACRAMLTGNRYEANRAAMAALAEIVVSRGAAWDLMTDWEYLTKMNQLDTDALKGTTGGKTILRFIAERSPDHLVVDAHSHEHSGYNYADVVKLLADAGIASTNVVGGFLSEPAMQTWTRFQSPPLVGVKYPSSKWSPIAIWGGATPSHRNDEHTSGVWRPRDADHFFDDDPAQTLFNIGGWTSDRGSGDGLASLLAMLRGGQLEPGKMYTATIMVSQCDFDLAGDLSSPSNVGAIIDRFAADVASGDLVWATLPTVARVWKDEYRSSPMTLQAK